MKAQQARYFRLTAPNGLGNLPLCEAGRSPRTRTLDEKLTRTFVKFVGRAGAFA